MKFSGTTYFELKALVPMNTVKERVKDKVNVCTKTDRCKGSLYQRTHKLGRNVILIVLYDELALFQLRLLSSFS